MPRLPAAAPGELPPDSPLLLGLEALRGHGVVGMAGPDAPPHPEPRCHACKWA